MNDLKKEPEAWEIKCYFSCVEDHIEEALVYPRHITEMLGLKEGTSQGDYEIICAKGELCNLINKVKTVGDIKQRLTALKKKDLCLQSYTDGTAGQEVCCRNHKVDLLKALIKELEKIPRVQQFPKWNKELLDDPVLGDEGEEFLQELEP